MQDDEINKTNLNTGKAKPISVSKEEALKVVKKEETPQVINVVKPTIISKEEVNKVNTNENLMKEDYVKVVEVKHSKKTYIIMFFVLLAIIGIIIIELIYFSGIVV